MSGTLDVWHNPVQLERIISEVETRVITHRLYNELYEIAGVPRYDRYISIGQSVVKFAQKMQDPFLYEGIINLFDNWETLIETRDPLADNTRIALTIDGFAGGLCLAARRTRLPSTGAFNAVNLKAYEITHPAEVVHEYWAKSGLVWNKGNN